MNKYSKTRLLNNIDFLIKKREIKIGELETTVKVSPGYFSRLRNNENDETCPNIDTLSLIAESLGTSLISLLYSDLSAISETESFVIKSINGIINKTNKDEIKWEKISPDAFLRSSFPLCKEYRSILNLIDYHFVSSFSGDVHDISNNVYFFEYNKNYYYLIPLKEEFGTRYEFYMLFANLLVKKVFCANNKSKEGFILIMESLYDAASKSIEKIRIEDGVKNSLESFIE